MPGNLPSLSFGPERSASMAIGLFSFWDISRINLICSAFSSWVPCEKFSLAISMPALASSSIFSLVHEDGPIVQTILVFLKLVIINWIL